jgi:hypothetical protein
MTAIAYRDGYLCADSMGWQSSTVKVPVAPKIVRSRYGWLAAACGDHVDCMAFREWVMLGREQGNKPTMVNAADFAGILIAPSGEIYRVVGNLVKYEAIGPFHALGGAGVFMLGAMHAGASAEEAVRLAILHTDMAGGDVQVEQVDPAIEASFIRSARCSSTASGG